VERTAAQVCAQKPEFFKNAAIIYLSDATYALIADGVHIEISVSKNLRAKENDDELNSAARNRIEQAMRAVQLSMRHLHWTLEECKQPSVQQDTPDLGGSQVSAQKIRRCTA
jgi:hypothetical protein